MVERYETASSGSPPPVSRVFMSNKFCIHQPCVSSSPLLAVAVDRMLRSFRFCIHHSCAVVPSVVPVSLAAAAEVICWMAGALIKKKRSCCHCCVLGWSGPSVASKIALACAQRDEVGARRQGWGKE